MSEGREKKLNEGKKNVRKEKTIYEKKLKKEEGMDKEVTGR